jgi:hypothetical protein
MEINKSRRNDQSTSVKPFIRSAANFVRRSYFNDLAIVTVSFVGAVAGRKLLRW